MRNGDMNMFDEVKINIMIDNILSWKTIEMDMNTFFMM